MYSPVTTVGGEVQKRFNLKCYKDRACANHKMVAEALTYARDGFAVSLVNDGIYINTMKAERKHTKICENGGYLNVTVLERLIYLFSLRNLHWRYFPYFSCIFGCRDGVTPVGGGGIRG